MHINTQLQSSVGSIIVFLSMLFLSSCLSHNGSPQHSYNALIDLEVSTRIIRNLITHNKVGEILEEHNPEQLALLLDNFSPASIAFESEVLGTTIPFVVIYYFKDSPHDQAFIQQLDLLAASYTDKVKFCYCRER